MKVFLVVHGIVQGVGYRRYVRDVATKYGVKGFVRNSDSGSVEIFCDVDKKVVDKFIKELHIDTKYGVRVFGIDKHFENETGFPKDVTYDKEKFVVELQDND